MNKNKIKFWPQPIKKEQLLNINFRTSEDQIEALLQTMFNGGFPVLLSSGRASISMALKVMGLDRNAKVSTFPYANHCVLESISRYAIPVQEDYIHPNCKIYYHQWGFSKVIDSKVKLIEDCVDTMYLPGNKLFFSGGDFEIWSLTKIFGTLTGGILWCKSKSDALAAKSERDKLKYKNIHYFVKLLSPKGSYFDLSSSAIESFLGGVPIFALGDINIKINKWQKYSDERMRRYNYFTKLLKSENLFFNGRLPNAIPIPLDMLPDTIICKFEFTKRHFDSKECFPLPIHSQVDEDILLEIKSIIDRYYV